MPTKKKKTRPYLRYLVTLVIIVTIFFLIYSLADKIPPDAITRTSIGETFVRIELYAQQHKAIPSSLDVLPKREGYANRTTDAWNQPLKYEYDVSNGKITLTGYGKSGETEKKEKISKSYYATREDGCLWIGTDPHWIVKADVETYPRPTDGQRKTYTKELCKDKTITVYPKKAR
jgi:hypothetical protein